MRIDCLRIGACFFPSPSSVSACGLMIRCGCVVMIVEATAFVWWSKLPLAMDRPTQLVLPLAMLPMVDWAIPPDRCQWCQRLLANAALEDSLGVINKCPRCLQQRKAAVALELKPKASPSSSPPKLKPKAAPSSSPSKKEGGGIKLKLQPHHGVFSVSVLKPMKGPLHPPLPPPTAKHPIDSKR